MLEIAEELIKVLENVVDKSLQTAAVSLHFIKKALEETKTKSIGVIEVLANYLESFVHKKLEDIKRSTYTFIFLY